MSRLKVAPKNTIAVVYYGGHAIQVDGINYFLPIDANVNNAEDVKNDGLSFQNVVEAMRSADIVASIIMLDACRENPFRETTN
jgi:uncharacterized caspase-like protein